MSLRDKEIEQIFQDNPDLLGKSMKAIAKYFYIQGELSSSHTREALNQKMNFYRHKLGIIAPDVMKECDEQWNKELRFEVVDEA